MSCADVRCSGPGYSQVGAGVAPSALDWLCEPLLRAALDQRRGLQPGAQNYLDAASAVPPQHLALIREIEIRHEDHALATYALGRLSLPARRNDRLLYHFAHEVGHLVFYAEDEALMDRWAGRFWWETPRGQLGGYPARVLAAGDWWQAAKEDAADSCAELFTGEPLDADRRNWLCEQVDGLAEVAACPDNDMVTLASIR